MQKNILSDIKERHCNKPKVMAMLHDIRDMMALYPINSQQASYFRGIMVNRYFREFPDAPRNVILNWADEDLHDILHDSYPRTLSRLSMPGANKEITNAKQKAKEYSATPAEIMIFGTSGARAILTESVAFRKYHGQHIPYNLRYSSDKTEKDSITRQIQPWSYNDNDFDLIEAGYGVSSDQAQKYLDNWPRDSYSRRAAKNRNPVTGIQRVQSDDAYTMVEDMADIFLLKNNQYLSPGQKTRYSGLVEIANQNNIPAWAYIYHHSKQLRKPMSHAWEHSRKYLTEHALSLYAKGQLYRPATRPQTFKNIKPKIEAWPLWDEEEHRLENMDLTPKMQIIYPSDLGAALRTGEFRKKTETIDQAIVRLGLRVPHNIESLVDVLSNSGLKRILALDLQDYGKLYSATRNQAVNSLGNQFYTKNFGNGHRFVVNGTTGYDNNSGKIKICLYRNDYDAYKSLAHEIHHISLGIIKQEHPGIFGRICKWYNNEISKGQDPTLSLDEMFASAMADEEMGLKSGLPREIVKTAKKVFQRAYSSNTLHSLVSYFRGA